MQESMAVANQAVPDTPIVLTEADRAKMNARARKELVNIISAQALMGLFVAAVSGLIAGQSAALSALAGAGAYFVPNLLFALRLFVATHQPKGANPLIFLVGEMLKMGAAVALLWMISRIGGDQVRWLAVVAGLIGVVKAYLLMLALGGFRSGGIAR
jgi:ATP synthase protein I